jgi:hypothetical protein
MRVRLSSAQNFINDKGQMAVAIWPAQGIEAVSFFAAGEKDTSGKPGFRSVATGGCYGPEMRPKQKNLHK